MLQEIPTSALCVQGMAPLLQVFDMRTSLQFYRDILGFNVIQSSGNSDGGDWVLLKLADVELMLNTAYEKAMRPSAPDFTRIAAHGDTWLYFGCPDVDKAYLFLREKGLRLEEPEVTGYGWKALHLTDPDGYCLCFHWPLNQLSKLNLLVPG